jgi:hypothetical protein
VPEDHGAAAHRPSGLGSVGVIADLPLRPEESRAALLESLAVVTPVPGNQLLLHGLHRGRSGDVLVVAVLAGLTREEALAITTAPGVVGSRRGRLALVLDAPAWTTSSAAGGGGAGGGGAGWHPSMETTEAVSVLMGAGWRVAVLGPRTSIAEAWASLAPGGLIVPGTLAGAGAGGAA